MNSLEAFDMASEYYEKHGTIGKSYVETKENVCKRIKTDFDKFLDSKQINDKVIRERAFNYYKSLEGETEEFNKDYKVDFRRKLNGIAHEIAMLRKAGGTEKAVMKNLGKRNLSKEQIDKILNGAKIL